MHFFTLPIRLACMVHGVTMATFIDFIKASDKISHVLILQKLNGKLCRSDSWPLSNVDLYADIHRLKSDLGPRPSIPRTHILFTPYQLLDSLYISCILPKPFARLSFETNSTDFSRFVFNTSIFLFDSYTNWMWSCKWLNLEKGTILWR